MTTATSTTPRTSLIRAASIGAVTGVSRRWTMAAYAMSAAATTRAPGFFTQRYHIASVLILRPT
ncbi:MAG: hypothetical protein ABI873_11050 [Marmoricola sp.]